MTLVEAGALAKATLSTLAMMAAQGTALALIALVLVRVGKPRPAWQAALLLVVLAKFALPWGPAMPWSLSDLVAKLSASPSVTVASPLPVDAPVVAHAVSAWPAMGWLALLGVWLLGVIIVATRAIRAQLAAARAARSAPLAADQSLLAELGARRARIVVGDPATGPYVVGVVRPIIVVPPALLAEPALLRAALLHELAHVRRLDAIGRAVQLVATTLFFFFPVVHVISRRLELAREAACDAAALESANISRPAYARLLVAMAALRTTAAANLAVRRSLDARIEAVLGPAHHARLHVGHRAMLVIWAAIALGGARTAVARGETETCRYSPQLATALIEAHPEADTDGDGYLSKDEACELQIELVRARAHGPVPQVSTLSEAAAAELDQLLAEPLCCNCGPSDGMTPAPGPAGSVDASCREGEAP